MWDKRAEYLSNNDGDTVKVVLDQGFGDTKLVSVRLLGVYAPELSQPGGPECKKFVETWFEKHSTDKARWGFIVTTSQLDFNTFVGVITDRAIESNLNAELAEFIHANGYGGGSGS